MDLKQWKMPHFGVARQIFPATEHSVKYALISHFSPYMVKTPIPIPAGGEWQKKRYFIEFSSFVTSRISSKGQKGEYPSPGVPWGRGRD